MCPYFWKYVLTIIILPLILLGKGIVYITPGKKKINKTIDKIEASGFGQSTGKVVSEVFKPRKVWYYTGKGIKWLFIIAVGLMVLSLLIAIIAKFISSPTKGFAVVGVIATIFGVLIGIIYAFDEYSLGRKIGYPFKLFGNMVYSLYKNVCPIIKWD